MRSLMEHDMVHTIDARNSWGAPNSNYSLVIVPTFVMPFSMDPMDPFCITLNILE